MTKVRNSFVVVVSSVGRAISRGKRLEPVISVTGGLWRRGQLVCLDVTAKVSFPAWQNKCLELS
jgi:hypothetical protein